jgi:hypothetical protein
MYDRLRLKKLKECGGTGKCLFEWRAVPAVRYAVEHRGSVRRCSGRTKPRENEVKYRRKLEEMWGLSRSKSHYPSGECGGI